MNLTEPPANATLHQALSVIIKVCMVIPFFLLFLCCIIVILHIFASYRHLLDTSRYILFAHMLVNDTLQLLTSVLLFLLVMGQVHFIFVYCAPLLVLATVTFRNTPLILAAMSIERYIAIIYPLQHPAAWRSDRTWVIMLSVWITNSIILVTDFSIGEKKPAEDLFTTPVLCKPAVVNSSLIQRVFSAVIDVLIFALVAVVILFTYVKILLETRKLKQNRISVSKAMHTVLLHGIQLLLCILAYTQPITQRLILLHANWSPEDISFFNFFCFILIPRFLSPLIYGFRDQSLMSYVRKSVSCCSNSVTPHIRGTLQISTTSSTG